MLGSFEEQHTAINGTWHMQHSIMMQLDTVVAMASPASAGQYTEASGWHAL